MPPTLSPASLLVVLDAHIRAAEALLTAGDAAIRAQEQFLAATRGGLAAIRVLRAELLTRLLPSQES